MLRIQSIIDIVAPVAMAVLLLFGSTQGAVAEDNVLKPLDRPDPSSIIVPDLNIPPSSGDADGYAEHYYFYKHGVSYEQAFADLDQCRMYVVESQLTLQIPKLVPLGNDVIKIKHNPESSMFFSQYGIVGAILGGIVLANEEDENAHAIENICMAYKGYGRYGTSSALWDKINAGGEAERLARQALIASGPQPAEEAIDP